MFLNSDLFNNFTYSKRSHFKTFSENNYDIQLFGNLVDQEFCDLKVYQDLLIYSFIVQNVKAGSKVLEIGGGESRILNYFKNDFECWNLDKLEGIGNGPTEINSTGIKMVFDYIGNFSKEIPENYFDLVFSISTLEHIPLDDEIIYTNILKDINRILKPDGISLHCMDHSTDLLLGIEEDVWTNPIIPFFFKHEKMINEFIPLLKAETDPDLFYMSEKYYDHYWKYATGIDYKDFGKPFSYNFIWKK